MALPYFPVHQLDEANFSKYITRSRSVISMTTLGSRRQDNGKFVQVYEGIASRLRKAQVNVCVHLRDMRPVEERSLAV